ncbi:MAG: polysulfide reductase NrfD [Gemmatimonadota bacterium]|nr:polysulfide reductase NrfD [Gemmatimonadota bacterium]
MTAVQRKTVPPPLTDNPPVVVGMPDNGTLTASLLAHNFHGSIYWWPLFLTSAAVALVFLIAIAVTVVRGIGSWGNNMPVAWAFGITNFVWWIGIGHAGTFISAFLLLLNQQWRASINRLAEAMTIFALVNAGLFPVLHLGRPWFMYWLIPYPATTGVWPNFKSSLTWDVAAITTYFIVSLLFLYLGLVPDLASARDSAPTKRKRQIYGLLALGWRGRSVEWKHYRVVYTLLGGLATPLVISVHSIVSLDFAITQLPGWHSTIFPPYFVVGAIFSGLAMLLVLMLPVRAVFHLEGMITAQHLNNIAKLILVTGTILFYSYVCEAFGAWYSGDPFERFAMLVSRPFGPYGVIFWIMTAANLLTPQLFWSARLRMQPVALWLAGAIIVIGMWLERFTIIIGSLRKDFLPSSWHSYAPSLTDWSLLAGSIGLFVFLYLAFLRWVPFVPLSEMKKLQHELREPQSAKDAAATAATRSIAVAR